VTSNSIVGHETSAETPFFALQSWFAGFQAIPRNQGAAQSPLKQRAHHAVRALNAGWIRHRYEQADIGIEE
jgi:hypothetical protein